MRVQPRQKKGRARLSVARIGFGQPPATHTHTQAALLVVNGLAVLNNDRCLEKWGLGHSLVGRGDGLTAGPGLLRRQVVEFLHAMTYLRGECVREVERSVAPRRQCF